MLSSVVLALYRRLGERILRWSESAERTRHGNGRIIIVEGREEEKERGRERIEEQRGKDVEGWRMGSV